MKYYGEGEPEDWPVWMEFLVGICVGTTGFLSYPFLILVSLEWVSLKTAITFGVGSGIVFAAWLVWVRVTGK